MKMCNPRAARSLLPAELILDDTPKGLPLVKTHGTMVLTCISILHRVRKYYAPLLSPNIQGEVSTEKGFE